MHNFKQIKTIDDLRCAKNLSGYRYITKDNRQKYRTKPFSYHFKYKNKIYRSTTFSTASKAAEAALRKIQKLCKDVDEHSEDMSDEEYYDKIISEEYYDKNMSDEEEDSLCHTCGIDEAINDYIYCDGCNKCFHFHCVNLDKAPEEDLKWFCSDNCLERSLSNDPRDLTGKRVEIYWENEKKWFAGKIKFYSTSRGYCIEYDVLPNEDNLTKFYHLNTDKDLQWRLFEDLTPYATDERCQDNLENATLLTNFASTNQLSDCTSDSSRLTNFASSISQTTNYTSEPKIGFRHIMLRKLSEIFQKTKNNRMLLLDVGDGGAVQYYIRNNFKEFQNFEFYAVNDDEKVCEEMREIFDSFKNVNIIHAKFESLCFDSDFFGVVWFDSTKAKYPDSLFINIQKYTIIDGFFAYTVSVRGGDGMNTDQRIEYCKDQIKSLNILRDINYQHYTGIGNQRMLHFEGYILPYHGIKSMEEFNHSIYEIYQMKETNIDVLCDTLMKLTKRAHDYKICQKYKQKQEDEEMFKNRAYEIARICH